MRHTKTLAQRSGRAPEAVTGHSGRLPETPAYGSWLLGHVSDSQLHRRRRTQIILALLIVAANLIGIGIALLLVTVGVRTPSVFDDAPLWITVVAVPAYCVLAIVLGTYWITRRSVLALRWAIEEGKPSSADQRNIFLAPSRVAIAHLILWESGPRCVRASTA